jgi:hypothetical protein
MQQTLKDHGYTMNHLSLQCDNESAIKIAYNPCGHSRTKHIDNWHHFLRDHVIKGDIVISHIVTNDQLDDIFTKPLDEKRFHELNIIDSWNVAYDVAYLIWRLIFLIYMPLCQKFLFMLKIIHVLWFFWFQAIHMFWSSNLVHLWPYVYYYRPIRQIRRLSDFLEVFEFFGNG